MNLIPPQTNSFAFFVSRPQAFLSYSPTCLVQPISRILNGFTCLHSRGGCYLFQWDVIRWYFMMRWSWIYTRIARDIRARENRYCNHRKWMNLFLTNYLSGQGPHFIFSTVVQLEIISGLSSFYWEKSLNQTKTLNAKKRSLVFSPLADQLNSISWEF